MSDIETTIYDEAVTLLPERALFWQRTKTLFIADTHWGKAATFRASAIPVPDGGLTADLKRLSGALTRTHAEKLIVLGDLIHAEAGNRPELHRAVATWRAHHRDLKMFLIRGNHDRRAGDPPPEWDMRVLNGPTRGPNFVLMHEPVAPDSGYGLAGHLHPAVQLTGRGRQRLRLPCFWFGERIGVLPAFASFTGSATIAPGANDQVYVVTERAVLKCGRNGE